MTTMQSGTRVKSGDTILTGWPAGWIVNCDLANDGWTVWFQTEEEARAYVAKQAKVRGADFVAEDGLSAHWDATGMPPGYAPHVKAKPTSGHVVEAVA